MTRRKVYLQPVRSKLSHKHLELSVFNPVSVSVLDQLSETNGAKAYTELGDQDFYLWGVRDTENNRKGWEQMKPGDIVLYYIDLNRLTLAAEVIKTIDMEELSLKIWEPDSRGTPFSLLYQHNKPIDINLSWPELKRKFRYRENANIQSFRRLSLEQSDIILNMLNISTYFDFEELEMEPSILEDIDSIGGADPSISETMKEELRKSRIGQGKFRRDVINLWKYCSVTKIQNLKLLKASHIKPWRDSDNDERLDPYNGLLLAANYDHVFDGGWITFDKKGKIVFSEQLSAREFMQLGIDPEVELENLSDETKLYLSYHREHVFFK
ncbi:HNH endonuclease [Rubellicoccus peritrichatus]|uniref:HNH endonuclease n=1 Tax=Rubellicoccus peritrichatus TaxID=3080537 RepID=A0AAQ3L568_9BACT|nr:HNH endonuclease [Puniceicoccus sp. CR14]WOO39350.1 HNH endonuclease [Puniceicoccus sp. CR14]